jgi:acylphosphatase
MTRRFLISGAVQGVGYRYFVQTRAANLGIRGWVRNLPDGRVEVVANGEVTLLTTLEGWLREGPPHARVADVEKLEISGEVDIPKSFNVR